MQHPDSQLITKRFFDALALLKESGKLRSTASFCAKYGINRRNLYKQSIDPSHNYLQPCYLTYLVRDFGVSAQWLLIGEGKPL